MKITVINVSNFTSYLQNNCDYASYRDFFEKNASDYKAGKPVSIDHAEYLVVNWQRTVRNEKTFVISETLRNQLEQLNSKLIWLVITEPWCGDSAQCLPALHRIAAASHGMIDLRIVYRDQHPELIDEFLTKGARSIPKLIQLNEQLQVTGLWGPRPKAAEELVLRVKSNPATAESYKEELHRWYAENKNHDLQAEISRILT